MQWSTEISELFPNRPDKGVIINKAHGRILNSLEKSKQIPIEDRGWSTFGNIFEDIAVTENLERHPETEKQKGARELIEYLFQNAEMTLGIKWPSKPDLVSVVFDKLGNLIIDQVVEIKTSKEAVERGLAKGQPEKTLRTIENIVRMVNKMISSTDFSEIKITQENAEDVNRIDFLKGAFDRVKQLDLSKHIKFSDNFNYHIILPKNELIPAQIGIKSSNKLVPVFSTNSRFSKTDIHKIIDHYAENNIE